MVSRFITFLSREFRGLHEAALILALSALASQVLALIRDRLLARQFGTGELLDIYYASFRIPDILFVSVASFVSVTVIIPFLVRAMDTGGNDAARRFLDSIFTIFFGMMVGVSVIAFFAIPVLAPIVAPGFSDEAREQYVLLSQILLLSPFFLGLSNLFGSITQTSRRFFVYAISPLLYNVGIIIGILFLYPLLGLPGLVWGVILGALMHFLLQIPVVSREGLLPRFTAKLNLKEAYEVAKISLPRTLTLGMQQFVILILIALASREVVGSIAVFTFSFNLQSIPLSIIGVSYSVAAFPTLSKLFGSGNRSEFVTQVSVATRHIIFWSLPITALFIVLRAQIVRVILGSGLFNWTSTRLVAAALGLFALSVVAQGLVLLFVRSYYAGGATRKPLFINLVCSSLTVVLALFLTYLFDASESFRGIFEMVMRVEGLPGTSVLIFPLAFSIGVIVNAVAHWLFFAKDFPEYRGLGRKAFLQSAGASLVMAGATYGLLQAFEHVFPLDTLHGIFLQGFVSGIFGIIAGVFVLKLSKNEELADLYRSLHNKFWRAKPIIPSPDDISS